MAILPGQGPCLACMYRDMLDQDTYVLRANRCLRVVPGIIAAVEVAETVKVLLGIGGPLLGRLFSYNVCSMQFCTVHVSRDSSCPVCGT